MCCHRGEKVKRRSKDIPAIMVLAENETVCKPKLHLHTDLQISFLCLSSLLLSIVNSIWVILEKAEVVEGLAEPQRSGAALKSERRRQGSIEMPERKHS